MRFGKQESIAIKGIAIILMIVHHLFVFSNSSNDFLMGFAEFGKICVALYTFMSGYGLCFSLKKDGTLSPLKRILKLYSRYWIVLLVFFLPVLIIENPEVIHIGIGKIVLNLLGIYCTFDPSVWFIIPYIIFIMILPLLTKFIDKLKSQKIQIITEICLLFIIPMLYIFLFNKISFSVGNGMLDYLINCIVYYVIAMIPFFSMGYIFSKYQIFGKINLGKFNKFIQLAIYVILLVSTYFIRNIIFFGPNGNTYMDLITVPIFIFSMVGLLNIINLRFINQTLEVLGKNSSNMWLVHELYCQGLLRGIMDLLGNPILVIIFTVIVSVISSIIIELIYNGILRLFHSIKKLLTKEKIETHF